MVLSKGLSVAIGPNKYLFPVTEGNSIWDYFTDYNAGLRYITDNSSGQIYLPLPGLLVGQYILSYGVLIKGASLHAVTTGPTVGMFRMGLGVGSVAYAIGSGAVDNTQASQYDNWHLLSHEVAGSPVIEDNSAYYIRLRSEQGAWQPIQCYGAVVVCRGPNYND